MPKISWDGVCMSGGNLDSPNQDKIKKLLDEFGEILSEHCSQKQINPFVFPVFKPFNSFSVITKQGLLILFASANGMPNRQWHDMTDKNHQPSVQDLSLAIQNQLGWTDISFLQFPKIILDEESETRKNQLSTVSQIWLDKITQMAEKQ